MSSTVGERDRLGVVDVEGVGSMGDRALDVFAFFECDWVLGLVADFFLFCPFMVVCQKLLAHCIYT